MFTMQNRYVSEGGDWVTGYMTEDTVSLQNARYVFRIDPSSRLRRLIALD
jgi:hypothetical protein